MVTGSVNAKRNVNTNIHQELGDKSLQPCDSLEPRRGDRHSGDRHSGDRLRGSGREAESKRTGDINTGARRGRQPFNVNQYYIQLPGGERRDQTSSDVHSRVSKPPLPCHAHQSAPQGRGHQAPTRGSVVMRRERSVDRVFSDTTREVVRDKRQSRSLENLVACHHSAEFVPRPSSVDHTREFDQARRQEGTKEALLADRQAERLKRLHKEHRNIGGYSVRNIEGRHTNDYSRDHGNTEDTNRNHGNQDARNTNDYTHNHGNTEDINRNHGNQDGRNTNDYTRNHDNTDGRNTDDYTCNHGNTHGRNTNDYARSHDNRDGRTSNDYIRNHGEMESKSDYVTVTVGNHEDNHVCDTQVVYGTVQPVRAVSTYQPVSSRQHALPRVQGRAEMRAERRGSDPAMTRQDALDDDGGFGGARPVRRATTTNIYGGHTGLSRPGDQYTQPQYEQQFPPTTTRGRCHKPPAGRAT